jgi:hypothetical protein
MKDERQPAVEDRLRGPDVASHQLDRASQVRRPIANVLGYSIYLMTKDAGDEPGVSWQRLLTPTEAVVASLSQPFALGEWLDVIDFRQRYAEMSGRLVHQMIER